MPEFRMRQDMGFNRVVVVFKRSRYSYAMDRASPSLKKGLADEGNPIIRALIDAHDNNQRCLDEVESALTDLGIEHETVLRSKLDSIDLKDSLVISVGGDGTLLETSRYSDSSPILGVNSDPKSSIGALCEADASNFRQVMDGLLKGSLKKSPLLRLGVTVGGASSPWLALNDVLFCHKSPAAMSRYQISVGESSEHHRSSGIWIATPAGSTGGIFSAGADMLDLHQDRAIYRTREPYWADVKKPELLVGGLTSDERLKIRSDMSDGQLFIDGPHTVIDIDIGATLEIFLSDRPLWLYCGKRLVKNRHRLMDRRLALRKLM